MRKALDIALNIWTVQNANSKSILTSTDCIRPVVTKVDVGVNVLDIVQRKQIWPKHWKNKPDCLQNPKVFLFFVQFNFFEYLSIDLDINWAEQCTTKTKSNLEGKDWKDKKCQEAKEHKTQEYEKAASKCEKTPENLNCKGTGHCLHGICRHCFT